MKNYRSESHFVPIINITEYIFQSSQDGKFYAMSFCSQLKNIYDVGDHSLKEVLYLVYSAYLIQ